MTEPGGRKGAALAVLVAGAVIIGLAPILVRLADAGPAAAAFWRLAFALPLLALLAGRRSGGLSQPPRAALLAGLMFALDLGFWHYGIANTSVANATVLSNLTPVVVTAFAWIFLKQRPRMLFLAAVALAVAGAWTMAAAKAGAPARDSPLGDGLSAATALWYALYMLAIGHARLRHGAMRVMFWSTLVGAPLLLAGAAAMGERLVPASAAGWAACIGLGLVHVAGQGSIAWALGRLPTATASVVVLVQPVVAAILGWLLFAEALGPWQAVGAAAALGGVALAQLAARPRPQSAQSA
jgi:drug/metabolite transporter (DMT)-like permease